jgi:Zn-dependent protease with chaperone function
LLVISIVGIIYALSFGLFFFVMHLVFVAQVRGSAIRLGPDQFPELYARIDELASRMGIEQTPETYLMQAGGSLNAFATKFRRSNIVVLYADLLEACGDNEAARDMIIAHELGHIRAGHLRWRILLMPAALVPFLSGALSRAREYTCDRYGLAGAGEREGALLGLTILAAGGKFAPQVNRKAFVEQRKEMRGWMRLGELFSTHPALAKRLAALEGRI